MDTRTPEQRIETLEAQDTGGRYPCIWPRKFFGERTASLTTGGKAKAASSNCPSGKNGSIRLPLPAVPDFLADFRSQKALPAYPASANARQF